MKALIFLGALSAVAASAQSISVGVLGGAPFTDVVKATNQNNLAFVSKSTNFTAGPSFQLNLPLSLRLEVDALYRPYSFTARSTVAASLATSIAPINVSGAQWTFPFLVQYRFKLPAVKPFIEGGVSFDHLSNVSSAAKNITSGAGKLVHQSHAGVVLGGGVDVKIPFCRLSGELRYTHQGSADFQAISNLNQAEVLVGVHF
ncbi:MAG: outer membrane beta-barrel protein [Acidobacteriota bacterium]|nr:outer membrane beta-barrel protein [Acidobacteriota bacterium]